jgi:hypothetical protein
MNICNNNLKLNIQQDLYWLDHHNIDLFRIRCRSIKRQKIYIEL